MKWQFDDGVAKRLVGRIKDPAIAAVV